MSPNRLNWMGQRGQWNIFFVADKRKQGEQHSLDKARHTAYNCVV